MSFNCSIQLSADLKTQYFTIENPKKVDPVQHLQKSVNLFLINDQLTIISEKC